MNKKFICSLFLISLLMMGCVSRESDENSPNDMLGRIIMFNARTLAYNDFDVTTEWQEINFLTSLDANQGHYLFLDFKDWKNWRAEFIDNYKVDCFIDPTGEKVKVDVQAFDENGKQYDLLPVNLIGGFGFTQNDSPKFGGDFKYNQGTKFVKMRVRSSQPFHCVRVVWERISM